MGRISTVELKLHELHSLAELERIRESWQQLVLNCPTATPFQTWEWNFGMAKFEGDRVRLRVVVVEDENSEVVGIAPFWIQSNGLPGLPVLEFIGTDRSDYVDLLFREPYKKAFVQKVIEWIESNHEWRVVNLRGLRKESTELIGQFGSFEVTPSGTCSVVRLPQSLEEYERRILQKRLRKTIHQQLRLLGSQGRIVFSVSQTPAQLEADLPVFFDLHQRRQRTKGERGRFFDKSRKQAFLEMSMNLARANLVRLGMLHIEGQPAACLYNLRMRDREYGYSGGMEPDLARHSPGSLLEYWMIGQAIKDGVVVYELLAGNRVHKSRWTNETLDLFEMTRARSGLDALLWRQWESWRKRVYRSRLVKQIYHASVGRFQDSRDEHNVS